MGMKEVSDKTFKVWLETDEHDKRAGDVKSLNRRVVLATFTSKKDADAFVDGLAHSYRGNFHRTEKPFTVVGYFRDNMEPFAWRLSANSPNEAVQEGKTDLAWRWAEGLDEEAVRAYIMCAEGEEPERVYPPVRVVAVLSGRHDSLYSESH